MGAPGCDDAPLIDVRLGATPKAVTFVYPFYENPFQLARQIGEWTAYPADVRPWIRAIVVDDCSPAPSARAIVNASGVRSFPIRVFRVEVDVRWNWLAAKNIGVNHAQSDWVMVTDIDHVVPPETARALVHGMHDPGIIYRFSRREHTGEAVHPHPNSWFMTRKMFWRIGGYDERMSGYYGSDGYYRRRCAATAPIRIMRNELVRWERVGDSSTVRYLRKQPEDAELRRIVRAFPPGSRPKVLSFSYHEELVGL